MSDRRPEVTTDTALDTSEVMLNRPVARSEVRSETILDIPETTLDGSELTAEMMLGMISDDVGAPIKVETSVSVDAGQSVAVAIADTSEMPPEVVSVVAEVTAAVSDAALLSVEAEVMLSITIGVTLDMVVGDTESVSVVSPQLRRMYLG
ncbi:hypothetical protein FISHEDRAFT_63149 [Fistulina hepatica ATCC 64428]|uniref:Uncharacterized protein n=1 Tax=Fistulina hepatica ATCC 64428 TaxID=1128425 RepID=A0A0D7A081_9AGAR|nr:hypothetical protein FISHEDRAFT_63149 [Fistulina hepatica ATCC 64428]